MILILNGPINSGKSTLASILYKKIPNCSNIDVDKIREFIIEDGSKGWEISFKASVCLADSFLKEGLNVIFSYHISRVGYEYMVEHLKETEQYIFAFTLKPSKDILLQNRGNRPLNEYLMQKLNNTYDDDEYKGDYGEVIDNTYQTPEETASYIYSKIKYSIKK